MEGVIITKQQPQPFAYILQTDAVMLLVRRSPRAIGTSESKTVSFFQLHHNMNKWLFPVAHSMFKGILHKRNKK